MDNLTSRKDVEQFLIGLRIRVPEEEVRKIVDALRSDSHKYRLYKGGIDRKTGAARMPITSKGTVDKIKKLYDEGELKPYLEYLKIAAEADGREPPLTKSKETELNPMIAEQQKEHLDNLRDCLSEWDKQSQFVSLAQTVGMIYSPSDKPEDIKRQVLDHLADVRGVSAIYFESFKFHAQGGLNPSLLKMWAVENDPLYALLKEHLKETDIPVLAVQEKEQFWKYAFKMIDLFKSSEQHVVSNETFRAIIGRQAFGMSIAQMILGNCLVSSLLCHGLLTLPPDSFWLDDCSALASSAPRFYAWLLSYKGDVPVPPEVLSSAETFSSLVDNIWHDPDDKSRLVSKTRETIQQVVLYREAHDKLKSSLRNQIMHAGLPGSCAECPVQTCPPEE